MFKEFEIKTFKLVLKLEIKNLKLGSYSPDNIP